MKIVFSMRHSGALRNFARPLSRSLPSAGIASTSLHDARQAGRSAAARSADGNVSAITHEPTDGVAKRAWLGRPRDTIDADYRGIEHRRTAMRQPCASVPRRECRPACRRFRGFRLCARERVERSVANHFDQSSARFRPTLSCSTPREESSPGPRARDAARSSSVPIRSSTSRRPGRSAFRAACACTVGTT